MVKEYSTLLASAVSTIFDKDRMTVKRSASKTDNGIIVGNNKINTYEDITCHLSFDTLDPSADTNEDYIKQSTSLTVFCSSSIDIQKGDSITITCKDYAIYEGKAGQPNKYKGRQSFNLEEVKPR